MTDDDKSLGDDATLGGESPDGQVEPRSLGDEPTHDGQADTDSVGDSSSLGDQLTFGGEETDGAPDDGMEIVDLESRYTIERVLGKGGMGEVLLATDTRLNRKVAIKRILAKLVGSAKAYQRFLNGAQAIAGLNHPNIVQLHDFGRDTDGPFMILEYVPGGSLLDRCKQGPIPLAEAIEITGQLCDGLAKAHAAGITHRDIKPANVLMTEDGIPKLTDFDLAKEQLADTGMTMAGAVLGTIDFMPPEQRKDATQVDARSDLWSLAATLYQMVTGETPRVIDLDAVPRELRSSLAQALKTNKDDRYQTAVEMGTALRECLTASPNLPSSELGSGECPSCHTRNQANRKFCNQCAGPLRAPCFDCAAEIPVWDKVCGECGSNQHEQFKQLQEERAKQRDKAERLLNDNDYDGASEIAEQLKLTANNRIPDPPGWLDKYLAKISSQQEAELKSARLLMDEAIAHLEAHDYRSGLTVLDKIPLSLRNQTIPPPVKSDQGQIDRAEIDRGIVGAELVQSNTSQLDDLTNNVGLEHLTPVELKEIFKNRLDQVSLIKEDIRQRVKNRELAGLRERIDELEHLQPGRPDLARLRKKLDERDARYAKRLKKALVDANKLCQDCEFSRAVRKISRIPKEFRSEKANQMLASSQQLAIARDAAMQSLQPFLDGREPTGDLNQSLPAVEHYQHVLLQSGLGEDPEFEQAKAVFQTALATVQQDSARRSRKKRIRLGVVGLLMFFMGTLVIVGSVLVFATVFVTAEDRFKAAMDSLENGSYKDAITKFDEFIERYPKHEKTPAAKLRRVQSLLSETYIAKNWDETIKRAEFELPKLEGDEDVDFAPVRDDLAYMLPTSTLNIAKRANKQPTIELMKKELKLARRANAMVNNPVYIPDSTRKYVTVAKLLEDIANTIAACEGLILKKQFKTLSGHTGTVYSVAFSPDGQTIASGSRDTIKLWDAQSGKELNTLSGHTNSVYSVAFSPDGRQIASGSWDNMIKLWDVESGKELKTLSGHTGTVTSVPFSPDGQTIASGSRDTIKLWDAQSGKELNTLSGHTYGVNSGHTGTVYSVAFSPDGQTIASGSWDETITLWDAQSGKELQTLNGHTNSVYSVAFSPDGRWIASGSRDNTIKLWDAQSGKELNTLKGHTNYVNSVAFSPDGKWIASGSSDNTIKLWDAQSGKELNTLKGHTNYVNSVAFSPDGKWIASGSSDKTIKIWNVGDNLDALDRIKEKNAGNRINSDRKRSDETFAEVKNESSLFRETRKTAEQGDAEAQNNLGLMYANGEGVTEDKAEAVKWFTKAAEQDYALAQYNLGSMYHDGEGVTKDLAEAFKWYTKAAEQGFAAAKKRLEKMDNGRGTKLYGGKIRPQGGGVFNP